MAGMEGIEGMEGMDRVEGKGERGKGGKGKGRDGWKVRESGLRMLLWDGWMGPMGEGQSEWAKRKAPSFKQTGRGQPAPAQPAQASPWTTSQPAQPASRLTASTVQSRVEGAKLGQFGCYAIPIRRRPCPSALARVAFPSPPPFFSFFFFVFFFLFFSLSFLLPLSLRSFSSLHSAHTFCAPHRTARPGQTSPSGVEF